MIPDERMSWQQALRGEGGPGLQAYTWVCSLTLLFLGLVGMLAVLGV